LPADQVTILASYGSLFFAAAPVFEEQLPAVDDNTRHSVAILALRERTGLGSTFMGVIERYANDLQEHDSRLILAGISKEVRQQLKYVGLLDVLGRDNIYLETEIVGESVYAALNDADAWIDQQARAQRDEARNDESRTPSESTALDGQTRREAEE
jgi:SulP family sulfate permease